VLSHWDKCCSTCGATCVRCVLAAQDVDELHLFFYISCWNELILRIVYRSVFTEDFLLVCIYFDNSANASEQLQSLSETLYY